MVGMTAGGFLVNEKAGYRKLLKRRSIVKKHYVTTFFMVLLCACLVSCAGKTVQENALSFEPYKFSANQYASKVDNFVVIMDASCSMSEKYGLKTKAEIAKELLTAMNETLPELGYNGELISFGPKDSVKLEYGPTRYSTSGFESALNAIHEPHGGTPRPLTKAINAAAADLKSSQGKIAVIIVSDGDRVEPASVKAAEALKKQLGDRLCIYTVLIGDSPAGIKVMDQIAKTSGCGYSTTADKLASSGNVAGFVEEIFLAKLTPRPVVKPKPVARLMDSDGDGVADDKDQCPNTPKGAIVNARGCWAFSAMTLFDFDKAEINSEAYPMLNNAVLIMKKNPQLRVEIDGHTDNPGSAAYNMILSERRAKAVMKYFVDNGVNAEQLTVKGFGATKPAAGNDTKEGRAQNRRVTLKPVR